MFLYISVTELNSLTFIVLFNHDDSSAEEKQSSRVFTLRPFREESTPV